jgi:hypothetical protein
MKGGGFLEGLYSVLFIIGVVGAMVLGGWLAIKYYKPLQAPAAAPAVAPHRHPKHYDPGSTTGGGFSPDPWTPDYNPDIPGIPDPAPPKPAPEDNFKPVLNLLSAKYDHVNRQIQVSYKILPSGSVPPSKSFSISYDILVAGNRTADFPEDEPLTASEMTGLQQQSLVPVTGAPSDVKASDMTISAQIHFRENGTANMGVIGVPVTINVA